MAVFILSVVFLTINCTLLYMLFETSRLQPSSKTLFALFKYTALLKMDEQGMVLNQNELWSSQSLKADNELKSLAKAKQLQDLNLEKIKLNNQLKMLELMSDFEMYLSQNKTNTHKFGQMSTFNDLKCLTQKNVLKSTRKIAQWNVAQLF
ncbi:hypothetical protein OE09_0580 [Flavobacteriaceae bacterium MAR_2010_72]|nr:hypothetical protein OE09_0580 [Flavobacteriaceae bacterium MAR_2010_72]TVZ57772.1 hypothetical protein NA63_0259 [Flavobacteriaceae bacterium MAR_2010_105]